MVSFSVNLKRLMKTGKVTQGMLAEFLEVDRTCVSKWQNGINIPNIVILLQIADYFGVTLDELVR